jgi:CubicO group peptidase (beta-lactamase class C family)
MFTDDVITRGSGTERGMTQGAGSTGRQAMMAGAALVLSLAWSSPARAQPRLSDSLARRIDSVFTAVDRTASPGCALAIYRDGEIVYSRGYGMASLEFGVAISPRTVFDIGSTSKQFAATAIALLAQDGKLSIDDDVRRFIPELPQYARPVTLRMLLNHTSGLRDYLTLFRLRGVNMDGVTGDAEALDVILRQRQTNFVPGAEWTYSNSGYFLLSQVVKRVTGETMARFLERRVFVPLGMRDTHMHDDHTRIVRNRATGYEPHPQRGFAVAMSGFEQTGDGAVNTTVEDLLKWDRNFYTPSVGGERLLNDLQTRGRLTDGTELDYALGLFVQDYRGLRNVRHGGAWAGYRAELSRFPTARTSVACLCNLGSLNPSVLADRVSDIVLAELLGERRAPAPRPGVTAPPTPPTPIAMDSAQLSAYAGSYYLAELGATYEVRVAGEALAVQPPEGEAFTFRPVGSDRFIGDFGIGIAFVRERSRVTGFTIDAGRVRGIRGQKTRGREDE